MDFIFVTEGGKVKEKKKEREREREICKKKEKKRISLWHFARRVRDRE